jgi:hypothetical protein
MRLADSRIHVRLKLSALWTAVMFCYVYGDFFSLYKPGKLADISAGRTPVGPITQGTLVAFAVVVAIPSAMVFLSLVLKPTVARWANIGLGVVYSAIMAIALPGAWGFYVLLGCIEIVLTMTVIWYAWTWPREI